MRIFLFIAMGIALIGMISIEGTLPTVVAMAFAYLLGGLIAVLALALKKEQP